jgi:hypothetical protein
MNSDHQKVAAGRSRYIAYPLLLLGVVMGAGALALGMWSGIPIMAGVVCFFAAWQVSAGAGEDDEKAKAKKWFLMFLGLVFAVVAKIMND